MKVTMPGRILNKNVGGNTTYARSLADGLSRRGLTIGVLQHYSNPALTMICETAAGLSSRNGEVIHYVADTGPLVKTRTPSVVTVHGIASRWIDGVRTPIQERIWRTRVKRAIESTDALITVSTSSAEDIADVFDAAVEDITVIPHGIDTEKFARHAVLSSDVDSVLPHDYVLYIGNIEPRKNIEQLIKAMECRAVRELGLPLVIAGKPAWNFKDAMSAIESSVDIIYLGFVSDNDRAALMQKCALFVFPSRYEGFGFPVLEAMAAGAPVLTTKNGALRDIAGPSKIIDRCSTDAIADGLVDALTDTSWRRGVEEQGRAWASKFTWDESIDAHVSVYNAIGHK